ncbi:MAG TPA: hypothetical protein VK762_12660, partial [Polyangiaceae bacterium]|nr:hypothetical protein [Polyangiaceae bacterium]
TCGPHAGACLSGLECTSQNACGSPTFGQLQTQYPAHTVQGNQTCNGTIYAANTTISGNLTVPAGAQCTLYGVTVSGNVQVGSRATFNVESSILSGNLQVQGSAALTVDAGTVIKGNVQVTGTSGVGMAGSIAGNVSIVQTESALTGGNWICSATISGNLQVEQSAAGATFDIGGPAHCAAGNTIRGSAQIVQNSAAMTVDNNKVGGSLQCSQNTSIVDSGNTVAGSTQGQCVPGAH